MTARESPARHKTSRLMSIFVQALHVRLLQATRFTSHANGGSYAKPDTHTVMHRYAVALGIPKGSVKNAVYADTEDPHHSARVVEGASAGVQDLLVVSGEEHDQGISPESYTDVYNK